VVAVDGKAGNQFAPFGKYACEQARGAPRRQSWSGFWGVHTCPQKNCDDEVSRTERGLIEESMDAPKNNARILVLVENFSRDFSLWVFNRRSLKIGLKALHFCDREKASRRYFVYTVGFFEAQSI